MEPYRPFAFPDPPPSTLVEALQTTECILFGGSELSENAGYPAWDELVRKLSEQSLGEKIIDRRAYDSNLKSIRAGSADLVADSIATLAGCRCPAYDSGCRIDGHS